MVAKRMKLVREGAAVLVGLAVQVAAGVDLAPGFDVVDVPYAETPRALTLAVEFRTFETAQHQVAPGAIAYHGDSTGNGFCLRLQSMGNAHYLLEFFMGDSKRPGRTVRVSGTAPFTLPGRWCRAVARWDGRKITVDVDGKRLGERDYDGAFVPGATGLLTANRNDSGFLYYPLDLSRLIVEERAWDEAAVGKFFAGTRTDGNAEADRLVRVLHRSRCGDAFPSSEIAAAAAPFALHPLTRRQVDAALAFALLREGRVAEACAAAEKADAFVRRPEEPLSADDFTPRFADALAAAGEKALAVRWYERIYTRLRDTMGEARPFAALQLSEAYRAVGRTNLAERMAKDAAFYAKGTRLEEVLQPGGPACALPDRPADVRRVTDPAVRFFVSPSGDDAAPGTFERPFRTPERARDAVRAVLAKGAPAGGVAVYLRGGRYVRRMSLEFGPEDSGTPESPVLWSAWKDETPVFDGGECVKGFAPSGRPNVLVADLSGVGDYVFAPPPINGFGVRVASAPMAFEDGVPLTIARYPDRGWLRTYKPEGFLRGWITNKGFEERGQGPKPENGFFATDPGLKRFVGVKDLMVHGYWRYGWADLASFVESIDPEKGAVVLSVKEAKTAPQVTRAADVEPDNPFFLFNALEALDAPGEWYVDTDAKKMYLRPYGTGEIAVAVATNTLLVAKGWHDFRLEGIDFRHGRAAAARFTAATNGVFARCAVHGFGREGVSFTQACNVTVEDSDFRHFGGQALQLWGGERKTLTPCHGRLRGCSFSDNGRYQRVAATLNVNGVGVEISGNRFSDAPASILRLAGNDHLVVSNVIRRACQECDDNGAVDIYHDPTYAGMKFLYNVWEDCGRADGFADCGQAAIRFDGNISGMTVYKNTFRRCGTTMFGAINVNGGRLNVIDSNVFEDCETGVTVCYYPPWIWWGIWEGKGSNADYVRRMSFKEMRIREGLYAARYPGISRLPELPQVNYISRNRARNGVVYPHVPAPTVLYGNGY